MYFKTLPDDKKQLLLVKISVILINTSVPKQMKKCFLLKYDYSLWEKIMKISVYNLKEL